MQINDDKPYDDINITPMLDLAYALLVIFILMTTAAVQGTKVELPKAVVNEPNMAKPKTKAITVNQEGRFFFDATPVTLQDLERRLLAAKLGRSTIPVIIRGDAKAQYQGIMDVMDVLGRVGLTEVGFVTNKLGLMKITLSTAEKSIRRYAEFQDDDDSPKPSATDPSSSELW